MAILVANYRGISGVSRAIELLTYSVYSHTAALFDSDMSVMVDGKTHDIAKGSVIEAWSGGVRLAGSLGENHTQRTQVDILELKTPLGELEEHRIAAFLIRSLGKKYAYLNVARFVPMIRAIIPKPLPYRYDRTHVFCTELVFEAFAAGGRELLERCNFWEVPPRDAARSPLLYLKRTEWTA